MDRTTIEFLAHKVHDRQSEWIIQSNKLKLRLLLPRKRASDHKSTLLLNPISSVFLLLLFFSSSLFLRLQ